MFTALSQVVLMFYCSSVLYYVIQSQHYDIFYFKILSRPFIYIHGERA